MCGRIGTTARLADKDLAQRRRFMIFELTRLYRPTIRNCVGLLRLGTTRAGSQQKVSTGRS
jgi:hypothetical protein